MGDNTRPPDVRPPGAVIPTPEQLDCESEVPFAAVVVDGVTHGRLRPSQIRAAWPGQANEVIELALMATRAAALSELDARVAERRSAFATRGKDAVYAQKQNEARACIDDPDPTSLQPHPTTGEGITKYPHLVAMVGTWVRKTSDPAADLMTAARLVLGKAADAKLASAALEAVSDRAKIGIRDAESAEDIANVIKSIRWPD
jgi:hypothetical protein